MRKTHELILHIGHYKTGTTALQVFLDLNRGRLSRAGLTYAQTEYRHAKHSTLAFALLREAGVTTLMYGYRHPKSARAFWHELFDEVRAQRGKRALLVSSEEFMRLGAHPKAAAILRGILDEAPDIRVRAIAYLRPPQAHLRSWYNQLIKLGHPVGGFDAALRAQFEPIHWDYGRALAPWIDFLGADAVVLRGFDDRLRQGNALYRDFLAALGFSVPWLSSTPQTDPNPRLDDRLLPIRRALNQSDLPRRTAERIMQGAADALDDFDAPADAPDIETIRTAARSGIETLARLPNAGFDANALLADLPRATEPGERAIEALIAVLTQELVQIRQAQRKTMARLNALEARLNGDGTKGA